MWSYLPLFIRKHIRNCRPCLCHRDLTKTSNPPLARLTSAEGLNPIRNLYVAATTHTKGGAWCLQASQKAPPRLLAATWLWSAFASLLPGQEHEQKRRRPDRTSCSAENRVKTSMAMLCCRLARGIPAAHAPVDADGNLSLGWQAAAAVQDDNLAKDVEINCPTEHHPVPTARSKGNSEAEMHTLWPQRGPAESYSRHVTTVLRNSSCATPAFFRKPLVTQGNQSNSITCIHRSSALP